MDVQLKELIEKIKSEGVKNAEEQSSQILQEAEKKAGQIVSAAREQASKIVSEAKQESARLEQSGKDSLKQAGRDLILSLKSRIIELFEAVIQRQTREAYTEKVLQEAIVTLIEAWNKKGVANLQVLLSEKDLKRIEDSLHSDLAAELKKGLEIRPIPVIQGGFRVGEKEGAAYYNFTDRGIAEILAEYLNPRLAEIINQAIEEEK